MTNSSYDVPSGPAAPLSNPATAVRTVRVVALLTLVLGMVGSLVLLTDTGPIGERIHLGQALVACAVTIAMTALLLFTAGWVEHSMSASRQPARDDAHV